MAEAAPPIEIPDVRSELDLPVSVPKPEKADAARVRALAREIDALAEAKVDLAELADLDAETLRAFAQKKAKSGEGVISMAELEGDDDDAAASAQVIDLMQVLRESLGASAAKKAPATTSTAKTPAAEKAPAKKTAARKTATKKERAAR